MTEARTAQRFIGTPVSSSSVDWTALTIVSGVSAPFNANVETGESPDHNIVLLTHGTRSLECMRNGRWRRSLYAPGMIGITPAHENETLRWAPGAGGGEVRLVDLHLPAEIVDRAADTYSRAGRRVCLAPLESMPFNDQAIAQTMLALVAGIRNGAPDLYASTAAAWLATHLLSSADRWLDPSQDERSPGAITDRRISRVVDFMRAHFAEPLRLEQLARHAAVSRFHFAHLFRHRMGVTPVAFLTSLRMEHARLLLTTTSLRVKKIGAECGYSTPAHFHATFRRHYGRAPEDFRKDARR